MTAWRVPTLNKVQLLNKNKLVKVLYYCPESDFYYDDFNIIRDMLNNWSRPDVMKQVKKLIRKSSMVDIDEISEKGVS